MIRIERLVSASARIYAYADGATEEEVTSHRPTTGSAKLAFHLHRFRNVSRLAHRHCKGLGLALLYEFRRCHAAFSRRENHVRTGWVASYGQLVVHAAGDCGARR